MPLSAECQKREWSTILHIAQHNGFPPTIMHNLRHQIKHKTKRTTLHTSMNKNKSWATFTYISPQICKVTNTLRNTNGRIAFRCHNTIANLTKPKDHNIPPHNKWGIYQLTCNTCSRSYVGQMSCSLNIHFQEHIRYIKNNNPQSAYAQHILQNQHMHGQMNSIMTLLKLLNNPNMPIPYEQYYIQNLYREGILIPEQSPGEINPLFQTVINPQPAHTTWTGQLCFSLQHGHYSNPAAPNLHTRWIEVRTISNSYNKAH